MSGERWFCHVIDVLVSTLSPVRTVTLVLTMAAAATVALAAAQDVPYGVGNWPEALGNHRARVRVEQPADAVWVHLPWRRRDVAPGQIDIIVIDADPSNTAQPAWSDACKPMIERLRQGNAANLPAARVLEFQAINAFHRFDPMEIVASADELKTLPHVHDGPGPQRRLPPQAMAVERGRGSLQQSALGR